MKQNNVWYKNKLLWLILLLGLIIRIVFMFHAPQILFDAKDYDALGKSISEGKGFNIEGITNTPYLGIRSPGYPVFLGIIYYLFGYNHWAVYCIQILLDLVVVILLFLFLEKVFPNKNYTYVGAFFWSINLMSAYYTVSLLTETLYIFLFMLSLYIFYIKIYMEKKFYYLMWLSLVLGYASLIKPFLVHVYVLFILILLYFFYISFKKTTLSKQSKVIHSLKLTLSKISTYIFPKKRRKYSLMVFIVSLMLFTLLSSAFIFRNYYLFKEHVNSEIGTSLAFVGGNPNMFTTKDRAYLNTLTLDEYKNFTPLRALNNSRIVTSYFKDKLREHPFIFLSNSAIRASLFWFEPFAIRSVFILDKPQDAQGAQTAFDKTYTPSLSFVQTYGVLGFFKDLSFKFLLAVILIFMLWLFLLILSVYGLYLLFFKYGAQFLAVLVILLCLYFTAIYALTTVGPRYFIQNLLLLLIPSSVAIFEIWFSIRKNFRDKRYI